MFGIDKDTNIEGQQFEILEPGIYNNGELISHGLEKPKKDDGTELERRIFFRFKDNDSGGIHKHDEIDPKDDEKKIESLSKRVSNILSLFYEREKLNVKHESFGKYATWVNEMLNNANYTGVKLKFKICGSVWKNKAKSRMSNFVPLVVKDDESISFTPGQQTDNRKYMAFKAKANSPDDDQSFNDKGQLSDFESPNQTSEKLTDDVFNNGPGAGSAFD